VALQLRVRRPTLRWGVFIFFIFLPWAGESLGHRRWQRGFSYFWNKHKQRRARKTSSMGRRLEHVARRTAKQVAFASQPLPQSHLEHWVQQPIHKSYFGAHMYIGVYSVFYILFIYSICRGQHTLQLATQKTHTPWMTHFQGRAPAVRKFDETNNNWTRTGISSSWCTDQKSKEVL